MYREAGTGSGVSIIIPTFVGIHSTTAPVPEPAEGLDHRPVLEFFCKKSTERPANKSAVSPPPTKSPHEEIRRGFFVRF
jgi:hypothetical protein